MAKIFVDNQQYTVNDGQNLLQACLSLKMDLPYFCWHPAMGSVGACRQCAMTQYQDENDDRGRMIVACMTPVSEGMRVSMQQPAETEFRDQVIAALMTHHPHDCPVCAEGGECHLQDMTVMTGHHSRNYKGQKTTFENQHLGPLIKHEMNRCITCYRCERFYKDYAGGTDLAAMASKNQVYFGRQTDGTLESEFAGNLVEVCPTGVFTDKPFGEHYSRKWDMQSAPSVCQHCSVGCNTSVAARYGSVRRLTNRFSEHLNGYFLCDRGRFGVGFVNSEKRLRDIYLHAQKSHWQDPGVSQTLLAHGPWIGIGSSQASLEDNFALQQLVGPQNFSVALNPTEEKLLATHMAMLGQWPQASLAQMEQADAIVILGEDVNNSAPRIALALRQALLNKAKQQAEKLRVPSWQDAAVRAIAPHHPVPLAYIGYGDSDLHKLATNVLLCTPKQASEQGFLLASLLSDRAPKPKAQKVDAQTQQLAEILKTAKRPLIVCGWSAKHPALLAAAGNIRQALSQASGDRKTEGAMLCVIPPQANSIGLGLLMQEGYLGIEKLTAMLAQQTSTKTNLLVLDHTSAAFKAQLKNLTANANLVRLSQLGEPGEDELLLPVSSFSECSGTLLNYQSLAQSYLPPTKPPGKCLPAWQWLVHIGKLHDHPLGKITDLGQLRTIISQNHPHLAAHFDHHHKGQLALQPPRASGRTAMLANQTVHEPKPFSEAQAPYKQTMEGIVPGQDPHQPIAYSWAPGWNSNQSVQKFRDEYHTEELGPQCGILGVTPSLSSQWFKWQRHWSSAVKVKWLLLPVQKVFGSDSLSLYALPIAQLKVTPHMLINSALAQKMGLQAGDLVSCDNDPTWFHLRFSSQVPANSLLVYVPGDHPFTLHQCDELHLATPKQSRQYATQLAALIATEREQKQSQHDHLFAQDQRIPIHFIEGSS